MKNLIYISILFFIFSGCAEQQVVDQHVQEFSEGFGNQVQSIYADENAPTDPMIVVKIFDELINTPAGSRPLRTIAGLDFGFQAFNDATEPIRKAALESMGLADWDGPNA